MLEIAIRVARLVFSVYCTWLIAAWVYRRFAGTSAKGFSHYSRHPDEFEQMASEGLALRDARLADVAAFDEQELAAYVEQAILDPESLYEPCDVSALLEPLGERAHSAVFKVLARTDLREALLFPSDVDEDEEDGPIENAVELIGEAVPERIVEALVPFVGSSLEGDRRAALQAIAQTGSPSMVPVLIDVLGKGNKEEADAVNFGLELAENLDALSAPERGVLFESVWEQRAAWGEFSSYSSTHPLLAVAALDPQRTRELIDSEGMLEVSHPAFCLALRIASSEEQPLNPAVALRLLEELTALPVSSLSGLERRDSLCAAARWLGRGQDMAHLALFQQMIDSGDHHSMKAGTEGWLALLSQPSVQDAIGEAEEEDGQLSAAEQEVSAAFMLHAEVGNGGFKQYFFNSFADDMAAAIAGLERIGADELHSVALDVSGRIGPSGPSAERDARQKQVAKLLKRNDDGVFEPFDQRVYDSDEDLEVLANLRALAYPAEFPVLGTAS